MRKALLIAALTATTALTVVSSASADIKIRQIHPDNQGMFSSNDWVELQFTAAGEATAGKHLITYFGDGAENTNYLIASDPPNAQSQRTFLIGNGGTVGGEAPDLNAGLTSALDLIGQDGAVCLTSPAPALTKLDCVAYGNFTGSGFPTGTPATAAQFGETLQRTIARGCKTALDGPDDTNGSAADFALTTDPPRNNSATPTEKVCPGGGGSGKAGPPNTKMKKRPKNKSDDDSPTFKFKSTESGSKFKCKLDHKKFKRCKSPKTYHGLDPGKHTFKVKAIDADGNADKTPAKDKFRVLP